MSWERISPTPSELKRSQICSVVLLNLKDTKYALSAQKCSSMTSWTLKELHFRMPWSSNLKQMCFSWRESWLSLRNWCLQWPIVMQMLSWRYYKTSWVFQPIKASSLWTLILCDVPLFFTRLSMIFRGRKTIPILSATKWRISLLSKQLKFSMHSKTLTKSKLWCPCQTCKAETAFGSLESMTYLPCLMCP